MTETKKQIAEYGGVASPALTDRVLIQRGATGSPFGHVLVGDFLDRQHTTSDVTGNSSVGGALAVTGAATFGSTLGLTGDFAVNTDRFVVAASSGDTAVAGTFAATGAATFGSTLGLTGNFTVNTNKFVVTASSGNTAVAGTFAATGAATFGSTLGLTGNFTVNTNKFVVTASSGNTAVAGTFAATGAATFSSTLGVTGAATFGTSSTTGTLATFNGAGGANRDILFQSSSAIIGRIRLNTSDNWQFFAGSTTGSGASLSISSTTRLVTMANGLLVSAGDLTANKFLSTAATLTLSGSTMQNLMSLSNNLTGTLTGGVGFLNEIQVSSDTVNSESNLGVVRIRHNVGGTGFGGSRSPLQVTLNTTGAISAAEFLTMGNFHAFITEDSGGTDTGSGARGYVYGFYPQIAATAGQNWALFNAWGEGDILVAGTASVKDILGRSTILLGGHRNAGADRNIVDFVAGQGPALDPGGVGAVNTWTHGYTFGGYWPMADTAELFTTTYQTRDGGLGKASKFRPMKATKGVALRFPNFSKQSGHSVHVPGASIDGTGAIRSGGLSIGVGSTGTNVQMLANRVTAVAVNNPGNGSEGLNNYYPGDIVYAEVTSGVSAQYEITHTKVLNATVVNGGSGGAPGGVTITGTTGTGTKFQATGTISAGGALTGALTITVAGDYTVNPTNSAIEPVTGGGLTGATVSLGIGALTVAVLVGDVSSSAPGTITPEAGSGAGLSLTPTWSALGGLAIQPTGGATYIGGPSATVGFYGATPVAQQTGIAVSAAAIHAALVNLGLITA